MAIQDMSHRHTRTVRNALAIMNEGTSFHVRMKMGEKVYLPEITKAEFGRMLRTMQVEGTPEVTMQILKDKQSNGLMLVLWPDHTR